MKNLNRRRVLLGGLAASGVLPMPSFQGLLAPRRARTRQAVRELDEKILKGMEDFSIPGSAVSVVYRGREHVRGFGVANITQPAPVDAATVFRLASNSKTYTGAAATRLVESGRLELDRPVRSYLEDFVAPGAQDVPCQAGAKPFLRLARLRLSWHGIRFRRARPLCRGYPQAATAHPRRDNLFL